MKFENLTVIDFESFVHPRSLDCLEAELREAHASDCDAIVLAIRSPGGYVNKVPEVARLIDRIAEDKPVFAYTDTYMASAAYWIGASADMIYAAPSADVGSIGAYVEMLDFSKWFLNAGIEQKLWRAGDDKARIGFDGQMRESDSAEIQAELDELHLQFQNSVLEHRNIDPAYMQGKVYTGDKALELGFIDGFADSLYDFCELLKNGGIE